MSEEAALPQERAGEVADLLVRVYEIHAVILEDTGGLKGLRESGLIHAAVARPFVTFGGEELYPTDFDKATALFHSLIKSHPFIDGNKRTAFASTLYFLERLGHRLPSQFPTEEVVEYCVSVAEENLRASHDKSAKPRTIEEIAGWLQRLLAEGPAAGPG